MRSGHGRPRYRRGRRISWRGDGDRTSRPGDVDASGREDRVVGIGVSHCRPCTLPRRCRGRRPYGAELRAPPAQHRRLDPRGDGAVQACTVSNSSTRRAASISPGLRMRPSRGSAPVRAEVGRTPARKHVGAGRVVGAVDDRQRLTPITSNWPGISTLAKPSLTSLSGSGAAKNASTAVIATAVVPDGRMCSGTNTSE